MVSSPSELSSSFATLSLTACVKGTSKVSTGITVIVVVEACVSVDDDGGVHAVESFESFNSPRLSSALGNLFSPIRNPSFTFEDLCRVEESLPRIFTSFLFAPLVELIEGSSGIHNWVW
jgi:hypothetical protein